jgi:hypothetical protein
LEEAMSVLNEFRTDVTLTQIYRGRQEYERVRAAELARWKTRRPSETRPSPRTLDSPRRSRRTPQRSPLSAGPGT